MTGYLFIAALIVGIFAWGVAAHWWRDNEWKRRRRADRGDDGKPLM